MKAQNSLDRIRIASACPADWERMVGNDRVRFCDQCNLSVYNIAELTRSEAELLIMKTEGRICARLYRRVDGTVITRDCPVGLRALRRRAGRIATAVVALLTTMCANVFGSNSKRSVNRKTPQLINALDPGVLSISATLYGKISDPNGDALQNATVTLINPRTNQRLVTKSNKRGQYHFVVSQFGEYSIEVQATPFQNFYDAVELHLNDELQLDVTMMFAGLVGVVVIEPVRGKGLDLNGTHLSINKL